MTNLPGCRAIPESAFSRARSEGDLAGRCKPGSLLHAPFVYLGAATTDGSARSTP